ncbi:hypothetical protein IMCC26207_109631 [Actinobacteria bacterium IMCC26207]|nr:hypothetical protein IMCC26207_109631 [Actinobacteria bacterium IMCC26207]
MVAVWHVLSLSGVPLKFPFLPVSDPLKVGGFSFGGFQSQRSHGWG